MEWTHRQINWKEKGNFPPHTSPFRSKISCVCEWMSHATNGFSFFNPHQVLAWRAVRFYATEKRKREGEWHRSFHFLWPMRHYWRGKIFSSVRIFDLYNLNCTYIFTKRTLGLFKLNWNKIENHFQNESCAFWERFPSRYFFVLEDSHKFKMKVSQKFNYHALNFFKWFIFVLSLSFHFS